MNRYEHGTRNCYITDKCRCDSCKKVNSDYLRAYRLENLDRERENKRRWRTENREKWLADDRAWKKAHPWRGHHMTNDRYVEMLEAQGNACQHCRISVEDYGRNLDVDHDHDCCPGTFSCGKCIRALVCRGCNIRLSWAEGRRARKLTSPRTPAPRMRRSP